MLSADPMTCRDGEKKIDDSSSCCQETDLQTGCAKARGIHVQKVDSRAAQYAEPGNIEIKVDEVGPIFSRNIGLIEYSKSHYFIITINGICLAGARTGGVPKRVRKKFFSHRVH